MRLIAITVFSFFVTTFVHAQWQGTNPVWFTAGNVGIGTQSPLSGTNNPGLHISHGGHSTLLFGDPVSSNYGGAAVQTSDGKHRIFIGANLYDDGSAGWRNFQAGKGGAGISVLADHGG